MSLFTTAQEDEIDKIIVLVRKVGEEGVVKTWKAAVCGAVFTVFEFNIPTLSVYPIYRLSANGWTVQRKARPISYEMVQGTAEEVIRDVTYAKMTGELDQIGSAGRMLLGDKYRAGENLL